MQMICRESKKIITLVELNALAATHFTRYLLSTGLAAWLAAAVTNYFSNQKRCFIDETMAGASNGLQMACQQCKKFHVEVHLPLYKNHNTIKNKNHFELIIALEFQGLFTFYKRDTIPIMFLHRSLT